MSTGTRVQCKDYLWRFLHLHCRKCVYEVCEEDNLAQRYFQAIFVLAVSRIDVEILDIELLLFYIFKVS